MSTPTARLLHLLSLLQMRREWPGAVLAERLTVSPRTVRRDVDRLRDLGYRIHAVMGPEGGYRLEAGSELPPLLFDDDQVIALAFALQTATVTGVGIEEAALRALSTVRQVMPSMLRHRLQALEFTAIRDPASPRDPTPLSPTVLLALTAAIRDHEVLRFDYASREPEVADPPAPPRIVEPHHLVTAASRWYLVAWDRERAEWRLFRADRISPRSPHGPRFSPRSVPGGNVADFVSARFKGSAQENSWPCTGTVILNLSARDVLPFAGDGLVEDLGAGRCRFTSGSWSWIALAAALCRFDTAITVEGPAPLTEAFATLARRNAHTVALSTPH